MMAAMLVHFSSAQSDLSLYNFNAIAQSLYTNPAMPQQTKFWIGLPGLSGVSGSYHNSAFSLVDLAAEGSDVNANIETIILGLDARSHFSTYNSVDLLGVGFKVGDGFFSMGARQILDLKVDFNRDLFQFLWFGNASAEGRHVNISGFDAEFVQRTSYYAGYQHAFLEDKLRIGARAKFLIGQQNFYVDRMNIDLRTSDSSSLHASSDVRIRTAGVATEFGGDNVSIFQEMVFPKNHGYALDLGVHFSPSKSWDISASILDLGYIDWREDTRDYIAEGSFDYQGLNANLGDDRPIESQDDILDSLKAAFGSKEIDGRSYTRNLSSRVFAAVDYNLNKKHSLGGIYHLRLWEGQGYHDFSVNYRARLARWFQFIVNYSVINGTYDNVGGGFDLKTGPVQLYVLSDNVLGSVFYEKMQSASVRVGINIALYGKKDESAEETLPEPPVNQDPNDQNNTN